MKIDEMYITLEKNNPLKMRIYEIQEEYVFLRKDKILHVRISSMPEWRQYVKSTSLQVYPKIENILKVPSKIINLRKMQEPNPQAVNHFEVK